MFFINSTDGVTERTIWSRYYVPVLLVVLFTLVAYVLTTLFYARDNSFVDIQEPVVHQDAVNYEKDRNFEQAGIAYQNNANLASDNSERAHYLVRSGNAYNRSGNYAQGFLLLKSVEEDPQFSPEIRAEARLRMLQPYYVARLNEPLQLVFSDSRYKYALQGGSGVVLKDLEKALQVSLEEIYQVIPSSYIDSLLAISYSGEVLTNEDLSQVEKNELVKKALEVIERGDILSDTESLDIEAYWNRPDPQNLAKDLWFAGRHMRFVALTFLSEVDTSLVLKVEAAYRELLPFYEGNRSLSRLGQRFWTNFYYAAFLARTNGENESVRIAELVEPFYETSGDFGKINLSEKGFWFFLKTELTRPAEEHGNNTRFIYTIASIVPEFDSFIKEKFLNPENI